MVHWPFKGLSDLQLGDKKGHFESPATYNSSNDPIRNLWLEDSPDPIRLPPQRLGFDSNSLRFGDSQDEFEKIQEAYEKLGSAVTWNHENFWRVLQAANKVLGTTDVNNPPIRPYNFMGGSWHWEGDTLRFSWHVFFYCTVRCSMLEMQPVHKWFKMWMESWISPFFHFICHLEWTCICKDFLCLIFLGSKNP